ncbi:hypothetical protein O181_009151 [Austropuccinia psidii MF-1]|uniref:Uncharacterized protein n=1 Tax=Austropuccinia psidii MF-1 TaxID=1389203 RepID=A0A9Q3GJ74_9BASI|nr:hypothetical protein [Austropuccinia psidii MF-1]
MLGPFCPNSNKAKRGQGGRPVGPPEPILAIISRSLKMAKRPKDPRHPGWPYPSSLKPCPLEITRGYQPPSIGGFPSRSGILLDQLNGPKPAGTWSGAYMVL